VKFPADLKNKIYYDHDRYLITFKGVMNNKEMKKLQGLTNNEHYKKAIEALYQRCKIVDDQTTQIKQDDRKEYANEVFNIIFERYKSSLKIFRTNLHLQGLLVLFAISVLLRKKKVVKIPFANVDVEISSFYLMLSFGLLLLWFWFGYLLIDVISSRMLLYKLIAVLEDGIPPNSGFSRRLILRDNFFFDLWFYLTEHLKYDFQVRPLEANQSILLHRIVFYGLFAGFFGFTHFCMIYFIIKRYYERNKILFHGILGCLAVIALFGCHYCFLYKNKIQVCVLLWCILFMLTTTIIQLFSKEKKEQGG